MFRCLNASRAERVLCTVLATIFLLALAGSVVLGFRSLGS